jgi:hypothetical protein
MKTLSVKQPWASLICSGIKDIENRTWPTKFRGRVLIHASQSKLSPVNVLSLEQKKIVKDAGLWASCALPEYLGAIIGSVEIVDCVQNNSSIWAERSGPKSIDYLKQTYNWVLANPVLFNRPIENVKGKLSFWDYPNVFQCKGCNHILDDKVKGDIDGYCCLCDI